MKGKDGVRQAYASFLKVTPDFRIELKSRFTIDKSFALEAVFNGTQKGDLPGLPATVKSLSNRVCSF